MRRRTPILLLLVAMAFAIAPSGRLGAQDAPVAPTAPGGSIVEITTASPWVAADGDFVVEFGPAPQVPADAELTWTIHQSLVPGRGENLRDQVRRIIGGESAGRILQSSVTVPVAELGDPAAGATLTIPIRSQTSSSERVLLPNPGIHPVDLVLTAADGTVLWSEVVFLNRLPDPDRGIDPAGEPLRVSLVMPVESPPAIAPDGSAELDQVTRQDLARAADLLARVPDAPLLVGARANTLDALTVVEDSWSTRLLGTLADTTAANQLMNRPYVGVDVGGIVAADGTDELGRQLLLGSATVTELTGRTPTTTTYALDDSVSAESLPLLRRAGTESLLVGSSRLDLDPAGDVDELDAVTRPMNLAGGDGLQVLAYDEALGALLADTEVDPGLRAHQAASVLMSSWFAGRENGEVQRRAAAIVVPTATDPEVLDALTPMLTADGGPLVADPENTALAAPTADDPGLDVALTPRTAPDQAPAIDAAVESRRQLDAYRSMGGSADASLTIWEHLNDESLAATLDPAARETLHATIRTGIAGNLSSIELPRSRSVVVTSQASAIPLRFRNDLPFDVTLTLRARSPRLDIEGGETRDIVLRPGENRIDLPVEVQAPGESLLRIELSTPDGGLDLPTVAIPVRSTAVSGVGAALSILSILFLAGWWLHTNRRARRQRSGASGTHPSGGDDDPGDGSGDTAVDAAGDTAGHTTDGTTGDTTSVGAGG